MAAYDPALVDRFLALHWRYHPVDAMFMGDMAHDHLLPPVGATVIAEEKAALDRWSDNCRMMQQAPAMPKGEAAEPLPDPFEETLGG